MRSAGPATPGREAWTSLLTSAGMIAISLIFDYGTEVNGRVDNSLENFIFIQVHRTKNVHKDKLMDLAAVKSPLKMFIYCHFCIKTQIARFFVNY